MIKAHERLRPMGNFFRIFWNYAKTYAPLIRLHFKVQWFNFREYCVVAFRYYRKFSFMRADFFLLMHYLFQNPYRMNKKFLMTRGEEELDTYGETPLTTFASIAENSGISAEDTVYELGCGRGRSCFWLSTVLGSKVVGIEQVPEFVCNAEKVRKFFEIKNLTFYEGDFLEHPLNDASVLYIYGTFLTEEQITQLIRRLKDLSAGTKIISVSFPLTDYTNESIFEVMKCFPAQFPWGSTEVYLQYKR